MARKSGRLRHPLDDSQGEKRSPLCASHRIEAGKKFIEALKMFYHVANIGDARSLAIHLEIAWEIFIKQRDKLSTKELNVWIEKAVRNYPPPATQGKSIKIKFVEQVQQSPPIFALFSNYPKLISIQYLRYLHNQLRESFDLKGITIKFSLRKG